MDEEAFLFMKGIRAALCFHSALRTAPMLFFPWPLLPFAREEFDKVTPGPHYLFLSLHLLSLSKILSGLPLISSVGSHLWAALVLSLPQHSPCHLFCCWNGWRTGRSDSISYILRLMYRTEPPPSVIALTGMKMGQGFTAGTSGPLVLQLLAVHPSFALSSLNLIL